MLDRPRSPVFVVGCHRSGTNLMYDTLLSAGGFARVRTPLYAYEMLLPRFGSFASRENRERLMEVWLRSKAFRGSGLAAGEIRSRVINECRSAGDFLCVVMGEIARRQNAERWAVWGPDNLLHMRRIMSEIPEARFVHVVRDGRDVSVALRRMCALARRPPAMDPCPRALVSALGKSRILRRLLSGTCTSLTASAIFWRRMTRQGRSVGRLFPGHYFELRYEDLVTSPERALGALSDFISHDLDYHKVRARPVGAVAQPNSTFRAEIENGGFEPIGRWKKHLSPDEVRAVEALAGECLVEFGYRLSGALARPRLGARLASIAYPRLLDLKGYLKYRTPLRRFVSLRGLELAKCPNRQPLGVAAAARS